MQFNSPLDHGSMGRYLELIEGELTEMSPTGSRHAACVNRIARLLYEFAGREYIVAVQNPVRLNDLSEPEPDLAVLKHREDFYAEGHPGPEDALLLIEVSDTSLDYDRTVKLPIYARHGIPEVWIVDPQGAYIKVYEGPEDDRYTSLMTRRPGQSIESEAVAELSVEEESILG